MSTSQRPISPTADDDAVDDVVGNIVAVVVDDGIDGGAVLAVDVECVAAACVSSRPLVQLRRTCLPTWQTADPNCTDS